MNEGPSVPGRRIAYLTYSTGQFDSRTDRMARSAVERGFEVVVYARWEPGLPLESNGRGYRIVRVPVVDALAVPWLRGRGRRRLAAVRARAGKGPDSASKAPSGAPAAAGGAGAAGAGAAGVGAREPAEMADRDRAGPATAARLSWVDRVPRAFRGTVFGRPVRAASRAYGRWRRRLLLFPVRPIAWAVALEESVDPADLWHGMWAASLPALDRVRRVHGGRTVYDSRDIYVHARSIENLPRIWRWAVGRLERRWARRADAVVTVNDAYARILEAQFGIGPIPVVRNTPPRYVRPTPPPDRFRERLGFDPSTAIVLYQGGLMSDRGIEQAMEAILAVPGAVLVLMGAGSQQDEIRRAASSPRYAERVRLVEPVPPTELLDWTASADVMLMAIQPTSLNHRFTTPNKLWEAIAAGVPVVASDLPGMAAVVRELGCGELVDPTDPAAIARGIRSILELSPPDREDLLARCRAGGAMYTWENEQDTLFELYGRLLDAS